MSDLVAALGLVFVIEGVVYALFPGLLKSMMATALTTPEGALRACGLAAVMIGVGVVWFARGFA